ncbi:unnamed protein product [Prorocentrum cordatum]|uniref:PDZ domain-containing protein n=1 Tax=Prorocentrum cordatum TaxID=2364126 RepID=A0ABN9XYR4_9DINO|nr:unnamed protein product [Polarella glacialis]
MGAHRGRTRRTNPPPRSCCTPRGAWRRAPPREAGLHLWAFPVDAPRGGAAPPSDDATPRRPDATSPRTPEGRGPRARPQPAEAMAAEGGGLEPAGGLRWPSSGTIGETAVAREHSLAMQPGPLYVYMTTTTTTGRVAQVTPGGQAAWSAVRPGWLLKSVDGEHYTEPLLRSKILSGRPHGTVFSAQDVREPARSPTAALGSRPSGAPGAGVGGHGGDDGVPLPFETPAKSLRIDDCVVDVNGQRSRNQNRDDFAIEVDGQRGCLAAGVVARLQQQQLQAPDSAGGLAPSPEAQQARASSVDGGASANATSVDGGASPMSGLSLTYRQDGRPGSAATRPSARSIRGQRRERIPMPMPLPPRRGWIRPERVERRPLGRGRGSSGMGTSLSFRQDGQEDGQAR